MTLSLYALNSLWDTLSSDLSLVGEYGFLLKLEEAFQMAPPVFLPLSTYRGFSAEDMKIRIRMFCDDMLRRRTVRQFSSRPVPREVIEDCVRIAGSAPSGANLQPWHFVIISDPEVKRQIRHAAEKE